MTTTRSAAPGRWRLYLLWLALIVIAIALGIGLWLSGRAKAETLQGTVEAEQVNVSTKVMARVEKLNASLGQAVKAGEVLAVLSSPELTGVRDQAAGALAIAEAQRKVADDIARPEDIAAARAVWDAAKAQADLAAVSAKRADTLYAEGVIAAQRRDEAHAARVSTARAADASRAQWQKLVAGARPDVRHAAQAREDVARSALQTAEAVNQETRLVTPVSGEVAARLAQPGEIVGPLSPVFQVIDLDHAWVRLALREDQYQGMAKGKVLKGDVPALGAKAVAFTVTAIAPMGEFATWRATQQSSGFDVRTFELRLSPSAPVQGLRPGMSVLFPWPQ